MAPRRMGTDSNFAPVRFSIAGIASWLRKALGLPKSNRNCGAGRLTAVSLGASYLIAIIPPNLAPCHRLITRPRPAGLAEMTLPRVLKRDRARRRAIRRSIPRNEPRL